ncbi:MAG: hypothetical protein WBN88_10130 [Anderseniella sp.]
MNALKMVLYCLLGFFGYFAVKHLIVDYTSTARMQGEAERSFEQVAMTRKNFVYMKRYFPELFSTVKHEFGKQVVEYCSINQCTGQLDARAAIEISAKSNQKIVSFLKSKMDQLGSFPDKNISLILDSTLAEHKYVRSAHGAKACQILSIHGQTPMYQAFPHLNKDPKLRDHTDSTVALLLQAISAAGNASKPQQPVVQRDYDLVAAQYQRLGGDIDALANLASSDADPTAVCKAAITYVSSIKRLDNPEKRRLSLEVVAGLMGGT